MCGCSSVEEKVIISTCLFYSTTVKLASVKWWDLLTMNIITFRFSCIFGNVCILYLMCCTSQKAKLARSFQKQPILRWEFKIVNLNRQLVIQMVDQFR